MKPGTVVYRDEDGWPETGVVLSPRYELARGEVYVAWDKPSSLRYRASRECADALLVWHLAA